MDNSVLETLMRQISNTLLTERKFCFFSTNDNRQNLGFVYASDII